jgi:hypothetical protein
MADSGKWLPRSIPKTADYEPIATLTALVDGGVRTLSVNYARPPSDERAAEREVYELAIKSARSDSGPVRVDTSAESLRSAMSGVALPPMEVTVEIRRDGSAEWQFVDLGPPRSTEFEEELSVLLNVQALVVLELMERLAT